jgi:hypothetical protein
MKSRAKRIKKGTTQTGLSEPELREALARAAVFTRAQSFFPLGPRLDEVLASLSEKLNVAFNDAAATERERYVRALSAVGEFLIGFNGNDNYALQFGKLAWALRDLNRKAVAPFLKYDIRPGRPSDTEEIWQARMLVVLGVEALLLTGKSIDDVLSEIKMKHRKLYYLVTLNNIDFDSSVREWRSKFINGWPARRGERKAADPPSAASVYAQLKSDLDERRRRRESDPAAERKLLLDTARMAFRNAEEIAAEQKKRREIEETADSSEV